MEKEIKIIKENEEQEINLQKENITVGVIPSGNINIIENGQYDVSNYENANVSVVPSGSIYITENGQYDVTECGTANVNVTSDYNCKFGEIVNNAFYNNITKIGLVNNIQTTTINFSNMFNLEEVEEIDLGDIVNISSIFQGCSKLKKPPIMDTSNVTNMRYMFNGCQTLENIPVYDTSNCGDLRTAFTNCINLNDDSLNNILQMCINATRYGRTKTLLSLGLDSTNHPASRIQGLSNYQAFLNAGWTIGY